MTKHNKNAKSKKRVLKKKSLRKTKRKNSKNSKRGGDFSSSAKKYGNKFYNKFKETFTEEHKQAVAGIKKMAEDGLEVKDDEDPLTILMGLVGIIAAPFLTAALYIGFMIVIGLSHSLIKSTKHTLFEKSDNSYNGGSIFRDGKALTHVGKNPCQGNENEPVVVKGLGVGLETHDEIYVCKDNKIEILESIARTRINRYISRSGMSQSRLFGSVKREYHLLAALYNVPDTFDDLKPLLDEASQNNPKLEKYITDILSKLNDDDKIQYAKIVNALKNAVIHYCNKNDQELSEVCKTYKQGNVNKEVIMKGVKVLLLPTLKEMGKYINARKH